MGDTGVHVEVVLAELAFLIATAGGDPAVLNGPAGVDSHFERDGVIKAGAVIQSHRLTALETPAEVAVVTRLFETVGRIAAASRGVLITRSDSSPGVTMLYFTTVGATLAVAVGDGRSILSLHPEPVRIDPPVSDAEQLVLSWYRPTGERPHLAVAGGVVVYSPDGERWHTPAPDDGRSVVDAVQDFVNG